MSNNLFNETKQNATDAVRCVSGLSLYRVQLITPRVPAIAVSTVISSLSISFQLIFMVFRVECLMLNDER